ncbi:ty1-copia retrotransposon protein [Cucumis melo var. makuwa]|uniref:Ty1-copia retrotransposon protein n=1 Tax=Cucumis melo var. makuwa TaxID=1194695 RepID=A0A5A7VKV2_CUCMM|nr:ty1-copia retrotransposon protein [Cucumis melo var. makuwa]TYK30279.1 ty1-copia retrotransposon protein [Cucumis melo var. makuwa]
MSSDPPATTSTSSDPESSTGSFATAAVSDTVKKDQVIDLEKYVKDNKIVREHLLNHMSDPMFDLIFQMTDDKPVVEQIHEYENLVANVLSEGMNVAGKVSSIME